MNRNVKKFSPSTKFRSFAFLYLNGLNYCNIHLHKFGHRDSPKCNCCECDTQDFNHLFIKCKVVQAFTKHLNKSFDIGLCDTNHWFSCLGTRLPGTQFSSFGEPPLHLLLQHRQHQTLHSGISSYVGLPSPDRKKYCQKPTSQ